MGRHAREHEDPLTLALAPPPNETPQAREVRLSTEAEAKRVSDAIDEALKAEKVALKKRKIMKMLLLGQSESGECCLVSYDLRTERSDCAWAGKTTTLKSTRSSHLVLDVC